jgi:hypothetical protein
MNLSLLRLPDQVLRRHIGSPSDSRVSYAIGPKDAFKNHVSLSTINMSGSYDGRRKPDRPVAIRPLERFRPYPKVRAQPALFLALLRGRGRPYERDA